jgi:hypothetical protein
MHDAPDIDGRVVLEADAVGHPGFHEVTIASADGVDLYATPVKSHAVRVMETIS